MRCAVFLGLSLGLSLTGLLACDSNGSSSDSAAQGGTGGNALPPPAAGSTAGSAAGSTASGAAGARPAGSGAAALGGTGAAGGPKAGTGAAGQAGALSGAAGTAGASGSGAGDTAAGASGAAGSSGAAGASGAPATDLTTVAKELNGLFVDVPCDPSTPTPLAMMATCLHSPNTQHIDKKVTFGGEPGKTYRVVLRVRGIWEPTKIQSGQHPDSKVPFTVGGMVPPGSASSDAINYQQYSIEVSAPKQKYWLNDHQYVAHDIHKDDYQATIEISGGAMIIVTMHDGNDHEIANWTKDFFTGLPPYDTKPSLGQMLRLDVVSVTQQ